MLLQRNKNEIKIRLEFQIVYWKFHYGEFLLVEEGVEVIEALNDIL